MLQYLVKRTGMAILVAILVMVLLALLVHVVPGDPATSVLGPRATPELIASARHEMLLDRSIPDQVVVFLWRAVHGNLGRDFFSNVPVTDSIRSALPHTLILAVASLLIASLLGTPLGVLSATRPGKLGDTLTGIVSISLITAPPYIAGLYLLILFSVVLPWFPALGTASLAHPLDYAWHLVLPAVALSLGWIGYLARLVRASMLEVMETHYIRTAYAYGLRRRVIVYRHALRNALIPTVAVLGLALGEQLGGAVFIELIFTRVGLGSLMVNAVENRNYPIVQGAVLTIAVMLVFANLIADLTYRFLDPRIRIEVRGRR